MEESTRKLVRDYGGTVVIAVAIALFIRFFLIEAYRIPTPAMRPTLEAGDTVFVGKWSTQNIRRGDVVLYNPPADSSRDYIKRVIAVAGDTVQIKAGRLWINGAEAPLALTQGTACGPETLPDGEKHPVCFEPPSPDEFGPEKIPEGSFFALGDFRTGSQTESDHLGKSWGVIPVSALKGHVLWVWLSVEPNGSGGSPFPKLRFDRMFRRVQ